MKATYINYSDTNSFSSTVLSYLAHDLKLNPFISYFPSIENFGKLIADKKPLTNRGFLVEALKKQYLRLNSNVGDSVKDNIELLKESNSFTVTTGHQLNIFTGPLYFIYKIVTTINLARQLKEAFPEKNFVPIYWMASEDHDFAEINHTNILGKRISWNLPASGATGRLSTASFAQTFTEYIKVLGISENAEQLSRIVEEAYLDHGNLADATRSLVNTLFSKWGLVVIDADDPLLKSQFSSIIRQDILEGNSFRLINETSGALKDIEFDTQVNAREINFFYMTEGLRERIIFENGIYQILNTDIRLTREELSDEIKNHPERFSPNVVMRPLYQELILPNLAYIGGGAEIVYWLQLKKNFDFYAIDFPILLLRNSALVTQEDLNRKLSRLQLNYLDIFKPSQQLKKEWVLTHSEKSLNFSQESKELSLIFEQIKLQASSIDPTLSASTEAVKARLDKALNNLEKKLIKAEKRNHSEVLAQIDVVKEKYFPNGGLQERSENFAVFYLKYGDEFFEELIKHFKPLDCLFTILEP